MDATIKVKLDTSDLLGDLTDSLEAVHLGVAVVELERLGFKYVTLLAHEGTLGYSYTATRDADGDEPDAQESEHRHFIAVHGTAATRGEAMASLLSEARRVGAKPEQKPQWQRMVSDLGVVHTRDYDGTLPGSCDHRGCEPVAS